MRKTVAIVAVLTATLAPLLWPISAPDPEPIGAESASYEYDVLSGVAGDEDEDGGEESGGELAP